MKAKIIIPKLEHILEADKPIFIDYPSRIKRHQTRAKIVAVYAATEAGLSSGEIEDIEIAGDFHDYGKRVWHYEMMFKRKERMNSYELALIHMHAEASFSLIHDALKKTKDGEIAALLNGELKKALEIIKFHHKDYNGNGYPEGVPVENTPFGAMVLRLADSYDAMRSPRLYRSTHNQLKSHRQALDEIEKNMGKEFHPELAKVFFRMSQEKFDEIYEGVSRLTIEKQRELYGRPIAP